MSADDKGKFSTHIGDDVINAALESVRKHSAEGKAETAAHGDEVKIETETSAPEEAAAPASDTAKELESLKTQLEMSQESGRVSMQRIKDGHEKMLRAVADLENYKKRAAKEKEEQQKFGNEKLLRDLLPVVDNFDRALEHSKAGGDLASLEKGVMMVRKLFEDTLLKHGVKAFESKGKPFDPNQHEAMQQVETDEMPPNHVVSELVRGFTLNDRLVRPALVMVSKAKAPAAAAEAVAVTTDPSGTPAADPDAGEKKN